MFVIYCKYLTNILKHILNVNVRFTILLYACTSRVHAFYKIIVVLQETRNIETRTCNKFNINNIDEMRQTEQ